MMVERKPGGKKTWCVFKDIEKREKRKFIPIILFKQEIQSSTLCMLYKLKQQLKFFASSLLLIQDTNLNSVYSFNEKKGK